MVGVPDHLGVQTLGRPGAAVALSMVGTALVGGPSGGRRVLAIPQAC
jgi:hypothetical protein